MNPVREDGETTNLVEPSASQIVAVITSYSIHYTKLYDTLVDAYTSNSPPVMKKGVFDAVIELPEPFNAKIPPVPISMPYRNNFV